MRRLASLVLVLASMPLAAQEVSAILAAEVRVDVDANGHAAVQKIDKLGRLKPDTVVYDRTAEMLLHRIPQWEFIPATRDGQPVPSQTTLRLTLEASDDGKGDLAVRVLDAATGPGIVAMQGPEGYPGPTDAKVLVVVTIAKDGSVADVMVKGSEVYKDRRSTFSVKLKPFEDSAVKAAMRWRFVNETVAGEPRTGQVSVPFHFCMDDNASWCREDAAGSKSSEQSDQRLALDPAVKLHSAVAGTAL